MTHHDPQEFTDRSGNERLFLICLTQISSEQRCHPFSRADIKVTIAVVLIAIVWSNAGEGTGCRLLAEARRRCVSLIRSDNTQNLVLFDRFGLCVLPFQDE